MNVQGNRYGSTWDYRANEEAKMGIGDADGQDDGVQYGVLR